MKEVVTFLLAVLLVAGLLISGQNSLSASQGEEEVEAVLMDKEEADVYDDEDEYKDLLEEDSEDEDMSEEEELDYPDEKYRDDGV